ncbi:glycogen synthase kinase 3 [Stylonychia lemnae]|uniref:Glycogen synthase kinase 3 n=1 Tax=Stylonychia lemnae TaxID=5949 RepID=A0A077ZYG5_STYLE|nr:glycogen synthase kinase 3 [Stylonychia lemnae]|eukprot:CDW74981.1 glycogen synthase kinase 3 [Stylonychia lemnae]
MQALINALNPKIKQARLENKKSTIALTQQSLDFTSEDGASKRNKLVRIQYDKVDIQQTYTYQAQKIVGNGTFGIVYKATVTETGETVAVKKVFQDKKFKNRELQILKELDHPNIIRMKHAFFTQGDKNDEVYLNIVMDFIPETVHRVRKHYQKIDQEMPKFLIKLYSFQILRGIGYLHSMGIVHRDIKPLNLLVDPSCHILKICDFGSAKKLLPGESNVSYICSRYYRAPELIFGNTSYDSKIDIWSIGCVIAELALGDILFKGDKPHSQLVEIIKKLGTPSEEQIKAMNPNYKEFKFPKVQQQSFAKIFMSKADNELMDLLGKMLVYDPKKRLNAYQALTHSYFDELRQPGVRLPNGNAIPDLFNFTSEERNFAGSDIFENIIPHSSYKYS